MKLYLLRTTDPTPASPITVVIGVNDNPGAWENEITLPITGHTASWTPSGGIIFADGTQPNSQIKISDADGNNVIQVGNLSLFIVAKPQLAANGWMTFGTFNPNAALPTGFIWKMFQDGTGLTQLAGAVNSPAAAPCIDPTGTWCSFTQDQNDIAGNLLHRQIWRINLDGTGLTQLTFLGDPDYPDGNASNIDLTGTKIAFFSGLESQPTQAGPWEWGHRNVGLVSASGGARSLITSWPPVTPQTQAAFLALGPTVIFAADNPRWLPDGNSVIYDTGTKSGSATWIANATTFATSLFFNGTIGAGNVALKAVTATTPPPLPPPITSPQDPFQGQTITIGGSQLYRTLSDLVHEILANLGVLVAGQTADVEDYNYVAEKLPAIFQKLNALDICQVPDSDNIPGLWFADLADIGAGECATKFGATADDYIKLVNRGLGGAQGIDVGSGAAAKSLRQINRGRPTGETLRSEYF